MKRRLVSPTNRPPDAAVARIAGGPGRAAWRAAWFWIRPRRAFAAQHYPLISLATAVAIVDAVRPIVPAGQLGLHWPNDVFAAGRKLAGILVEVLPDGKHIVGMGLNINNRAADAPAELRARATSLARLARRENIARPSVSARAGAALAQPGATGGRLPRQLARRADRACLQHGQALTSRIGRSPRRRHCAGHRRRRGT